MSQNFWRWVEKASISFALENCDFVKRKNKPKVNRPNDELYEIISG